MRQIILSAMLFGVSGYAFAEPQFARQYKSEYGYNPSCNACHKDGGGSPVNDFGKAFENAKMNQAAFKAIAKLDSDGDGALNIDEIKARSNPGDSGSTPDDKGNWLDTSNLIPKPVQKAFPGVKTYKPLDAIFTESETQRAADLGVKLIKADENTIYVPVKDGKAGGTAIIVPAVHEGRQFFLLVVTDPKLVITEVTPVNTKNVKEAEKSAAYTRFKGQSVDAIQVSGEGVDKAIAEGVKKAGAILFVRLKK